MSTYTRAAGKALLKSLNNYENQKKMVSRAMDPTNPSLEKSHAKNRVKLEEAFSDLSFDWKVYKDDLNIDATEFNAMEEDSSLPKYQHNDDWFKSIEGAFFELLEKSDEKLEAGSVPDTGVQDSREEKVEVQRLEEEKEIRLQKKMADNLCNQISSLSENITASIDVIVKEVSRMDDGGENVARV